ncbi:DUF799 domain-containing protein [Niveispirillum cyanobacteriorum]|uniref:Uncharacterized protein n=1 Tax=Niveispirillum cyanobacteriorum TaxID=1612173 RepID=A0A2K9NA74_9PROT|nr:GNA1162 family protein [Niveispirillum cyanobacteriorum]AUN30050.1 hypothetical protein C0V82_07265 [Niveispirillum cyanobacteriorum]GGE88509.1 lipoprotein [Niveispirillum cyanobacteriorum]
MRMIKLLSAGLLLLGLSACATPEIPKKDFSAFRDQHPRSIVVVPVVNKSTQVDAADNFLVTLPGALAEKGYYVFPVHMVKRFMEDEGLADANLVHSADPTRVANLFGADAVMFVSLEKWDSAYAVLATTTTVSLSYVLKHGKTGQTIWTDEVTLAYSPQAQNSGGNLLASLIAQAVIAAVERAKPSYLPLANQANSMALYAPGHGMPTGPYDANHGKDY